MTIVSPRAWAALTPGVFVFLWSTGFIGAKLGLPYAEPMTFLALRFALVTVLLAAFALAVRAPWPRSATEAGHYAFAGFLVHGLYLGGIFAAIGRGVPAGVSALVVSLQPLLVAAVAGRLLGERVWPRQWVGLALGLVGTALVVWHKAGVGQGDAIGLAQCVVALLGISFGTLYQKRFCQGMDLRTGNVFQFGAAALATGVVALLVDTKPVVWSGEFVFALAWLVIFLSFGAVTLLYRLIRRGVASRVSSLFFLVPPTTALLAWLLFDERLGPVELAGMAVAAVGVALVNLQPGEAARAR